MWVLRGDDNLTFRLRPGATRTLGRATRADFIVDADLVSRIHCRLTVTPAGELQVSDLDSTNGTYVNRRRVERATLVAGDTLTVGRMDLTVERAARNEEG
jgi:pSer/pThr/pTyr-binding forkhead associated (FHA) protein